MSQDQDRRARLERILARYAAAMGGALLGGAAAQAEVEYTRAGPDVLDQPGSRSTPTALPLDIDQDGSADFFLELSSDGSNHALLGISPTASPAGPTPNAIASASASIGPSYASALSKGTSIGGSLVFNSKRSRMLSVYRTSTGSVLSRAYLYGAWRFPPPSFLGLRFLINGQEHFGWARISVDNISTPSAVSISATLLDFAYETQAGVAITADVPPISRRVRAATAFDTPVDVTLEATDDDDPGATLSFRVTSGPANGTLDIALNTPTTNATVRYTPDAGFAGTDSFVYRASDGTVEGPPATVEVLVADDAVTQVIRRSSSGCASVPGNDPLAAAPLGVLALGALGIRAWKRRRLPAIATPS